MSKCDKCVADKFLCSKCVDHPKVQKILASLPKYSNFMYYKAVCPCGYLDCIYDPGYIHFHYPDWYKELYGDLTPEEAIKKEGGCLDRIKDNLGKDCDYYDDEDK